MRFQEGREGSDMSGMKERTTVTEMERVLTQEIELFKSYMVALNLDNELMAKLKIAGLEENNKAKNTILLKLKAMDQGRQNLVRQFAHSHGMAESDVRILDICQYASAEESKRLTDLKNELQRITGEIKILQGKTAALANASLGWVNSSIATLKKMLTPVVTYNLQGKIGGDDVFSGRVVEKRV
jgi:hypothetical protein